VSSSRKSRVCQRKPLPVLETRCHNMKSFQASDDAPTLGLARHSLHQHK
jgi:hypothetical protein